MKGQSITIFYKLSFFSIVRKAITYNHILLCISNFMSTCKCLMYHILSSYDWVTSEHSLYFCIGSLSENILLDMLGTLLLQPSHKYSTIVSNLNDHIFLVFVNKMFRSILIIVVCIWLFENKYLSICLCISPILLIKVVLYRYICSGDTVTSDRIEVLLILVENYNAEIFFRQKT